MAVIQESGIRFDAATNFSRAFGANVQVGSLIVVAVWSSSATPFVLANCTKIAGTATIAGLQFDEENDFDVGAAEIANAGIWSAIVTGAGSLTMQVATPAGTYGGIGIVEAGGSWDATRREDHQVGQTAPDDTTAIDTAPLTSAGAGLFVGAVAVMGSEAGVIFTPNSPFINIVSETDNTAHQAGAIARNLYVAGTTDTVGWTIPGGVANRGWTAVGVVYREAGGGGAGPQDSTHGSRRNRPGRGPYSLGRMYRPRVDAFSSSVVIDLVGAAVASAVGSGALTHAVPLQGAALSSAIANGSLSLTVNLAGDAFVAALAAAQMSHVVPLAGSATAGASASAALSTNGAVDLAGNAIASSNAAATLSLIVNLSGAAIAQATAAADLAHGVPLAGAAAASAQAAGVLSLTTRLTGNAIAGATAAGGLTHHVPLQGAASAGAQGEASLQGTVSLSGAASAGAQAAGTLTLVVSLSAQAVANALASGALSLSVNLAGAAIARALAGGELTVLADVHLQGAAQARAVAAAALSVVAVDFRPITRIEFRPMRARSITFRLN